MLRALHIENIAVIRTLDLEAGGGFTWYKGEIIAETERTFKIEIPKRKENSKSEEDKL